MREIKFRAWIPEVNILRDVINFDLDEPDDVYSRLPQVKIWDHPSTRAAKIKGRVATYFKKDLILMQFTGLKDRNGKEIYEGDIVNLSYLSLPYEEADDDECEIITHKGVIHYECGSFWFAGEGLSENCHFHYNDADREIIGNIYENPDLLEAKP